MTSWRLVVMATLVGWAADARAAPSPVEKVDAFVQTELARQKIPGMAVAVVQRGKVVLAKGYGFANVELGVPVSPETKFLSASVGKQFTAAAVMALVEDGKLSLDDSIVKFYPDAPWRWRGITVRHLLTHTSGIPDYDSSAFDYRKDYSEDDLARIAFGMKLEFEPGTRWNYSNTGYALLGGVVRKATGRFYGDVLRERIFLPLGMKTARVNSESDLIRNRAAGYQLDKGELKNQEWVSPTLNTTADGSLSLSILDLVAWDAGIRTRGALRPESWNTIFAPVKLATGKTYPYGFGWFVDDFEGQARQHHGGAWQGFKTYIARYLADDLTIMVLVNLADADPGELARDIAALFEPKLARSEAPIPDRDPEVTDRVRRLIAAAREGRLSPDEFAWVRAGFFPSAPKAYQEALQGAGALMRLEPLWVREMGDDRAFAYVATFEKKGAFDVTIKVAPDGKLAGFGIRPRAPRS
jgi:CubicO group peptidase (beta-lactamase class C family)